MANRNLNGYGCENFSYNEGMAVGRLRVDNGTVTESDKRMMI